MWGQIIGNKSGRLDTWAIFWYVVIFQQKGLCLSPVISFVRNIGFDGSGVHSGSHPNFSTDVLCQKDVDFSKIEIKENLIALKSIMKFNKKDRGNIILRGIRKVIRGFKKIYRLVMEKKEQS
jgi:hypothetical protein